MSMFRRPFALLFAVIAAVVAALTAAHLTLVPERIALNYNEGWMAFFADRAMAGGDLYPAPGGMISNNYPPLSFFVIGTVGRLVGDQIAAGRAVALLALGAVAAEIWWCARRLGSNVQTASSGALLFALFNLTWFQAYVAMADPQWLGQAVMMAGLPLLIGTSDAPLPPGRVAASALLMVAGGLVKHNLVALPLACSLWLMLHDRRAFLVWSAAAAAALAVAAAWVARTWGAAAFVDVFGEHRRLLIGQLPDAVVYLLPMAPMIAAAVWLAKRRGGEPRVRLALFFAAVALPLGVIQRLGEGVNINGHFEALTAVCLTSAVALQGGPAILRGRRWSTPALAAALAAPMLAAAPYALWKGASDMIETPARRADWGRLIASTRAAPGPAACEMLSLCYWAGKGFALDFFNYGQDLRAGTSPARLAGLIDARAFGALVLVRDAAFARGEGRLPRPIPDRIEAAYDARLTGPGHLVMMVPRRPPSGSRPGG